MPCRACGFAEPFADRCPRCGAASRSGPVDVAAQLPRLHQDAPRSPAAGPGTPTAPERPPAMLLIGGAFALGSALTLLSAVTTLLSLGSLGEMAAQIPTLPEGGPSGLQALATLPRLLAPLGLLELAAGAFGLVASVEFLRRRVWARAALEYLAWSALASGIGLALFGAAAWVGLGSALPGGGASPALVTLGVLLVLLLAIAWVAPLLWLIRLLRSEAVRRALVR